MIRRNLIGLLCGMTLACVACATPLEVVYPHYQEGMGRHEFALKVLTLALEKSGQPFQLKMSDIEAPQSRFERLLAEGSGISVMWAGTTPQLETELQPIRIPIYRGLLGYRISLIHRDKQNLFDHISGLEDLAALSAGQGIGWGDVRILREAGLTVEEHRYDTLLQMLNHGRLDYFPRGINEVFLEHDLQRFQYANLEIEQKLLIYYPLYLYFFVAPGDQALAGHIEEGFKTAYRDGSFLALFESDIQIQRFLNDARLHQRRLISIANPAMTKSSKSLPGRYLYRIQLQVP